MLYQRLLWLRVWNLVGPSPPFFPFSLSYYARSIYVPETVSLSRSRLLVKVRIFIVLVVLLMFPSLSTQLISKAIESPGLRQWQSKNLYREVCRRLLVYYVASTECKSMTIRLRMTKIIYLSGSWNGSNVVSQVSSLCSGHSAELFSCEIDKIMCHFRRELC